jgi:hypothetical protein
LGRERAQFDRSLFCMRLKGGRKKLVTLYSFVWCDEAEFSVESSSALGSGTLSLRAPGRYAAEYYPGVAGSHAAFAVGTFVVNLLQLGIDAAGEFQPSRKEYGPCECPNRP